MGTDSCRIPSSGASRPGTTMARRPSRRISPGSCAREAQGEASAKIMMSCDGAHNVVPMRYRPAGVMELRFMNLFCLLLVPSSKARSAPSSVLAPFVAIGSDAPCSVRSFLLLVASSLSKQPIHQCPAVMDPGSDVFAGSLAWMLPAEPEAKVQYFPVLPTYHSSKKLLSSQGHRY